MKKVVSLALVLAMLLSVFALSAAVVSADAGQYRKVVVDFDSDLYSYDYGSTYGKGVKYTETIEYQAAVGSNAFSATTLTAEREYQYISVKNWNTGSAAPVAVSFKYWTDIPAGSNFTVQVTDGTLDSEEQTLALSDTPVEATVDLTAYAESTGADLDLRFNTIGTLENPWTFFVDDITFVYASAADLPTETSWITMYDWEDDSQQANVSQPKKTWKVAALGGSNMLWPYCSYNETNAKNNPVSIKLSDAFKTASPTNLRLYYRFENGVNGNNPAVFGVKIGNNIYWGSKITSSSARSIEYSFIAKDYTNAADAEDVITLTADNIASVDAIMIALAVTWNNNGIDDIGYQVSNVPAETVDAAFADGSKQTLAITDCQVTLPAADLSTGKVSLGWWVDGKLYQNGATVAATTDSTIASAVVGFTQTDGGSVRIKDPTGLRFQTKVNMADYEKIKGSVTEQGGVLALTDVVGASAVTVDNEKCIKVVDADNAFHADSTDTDGIYYSSIVGIPAENYGTNISARGYMTVSYADGSSATVYTALTTVRNIRGVAQSAQADTEYYNTLTPEQKAIIDGFAAEA